jgi:hypothetical protein
VINDDENPVITCTVLQLAFVAWQKRLGSDDLAETGASWERFIEWWDAALAAPGFASIREACRKAWVAASPRHGEHEQFDAWWKTILDARPVISA